MYVYIYFLLLFWFLDEKLRLERDRVRRLG